MESFKVFKCFKEVNNDNGIVRVVKYLEANATKTQMMHFLNIPLKFMEEYTHEMLIRKVVETRKWKDIIEKWDIENVRICTHCGELMTEGVYADGDYYCSEECLEQGLGVEKYLELAQEDEEYPDEYIEYYYTEW